MTKSSSWVAMMYRPSGEKNASSGLQERLAGREVAGPRELPPDPALRVDDQQPVVVMVGDEDVGGQHRRVRTRRQPAGPRGRRQPRRRAACGACAGRAPAGRSSLRAPAAVVLAADQVPVPAGRRLARVARPAPAAHPPRSPGPWPGRTGTPSALVTLRGHPAREVDPPVQADHGRALDRPRQVPGHGGRAGGRVDPLDDVRRHPPASGRRTPRSGRRPTADAAYRTGTASRAATRKCCPSLVASTRGFQRGAVVAPDHVADRSRRYASGIRTGLAQTPRSPRLAPPGPAPGRWATLARRPAAEHERPAAQAAGPRHRAWPAASRPAARVAPVTGSRLVTVLGRRPRRGQPAGDQQPVGAGQHHLAGQAQPAAGKARA